MGLRYCLFGCLLALAGTGTAAATGVATQDPGTQHATLDSGSRDGGGSDASASNRDCIPGAGSDNADADSGGGTGGSTPPPHASHRSSLGWQSLLPGSIQ